MTQTSDEESGGATPKGRTPNTTNQGRTPEEFSLETRYVVLNYFSLIPSTSLEDSQLLNASSGSSNRTASHHSRSSSNSSHRDQLLEFTDDQISHNLIVDSEGEALQLKRPVALRKGTPRMETAASFDHSVKTNTPPRKLDLRKTKSFGNEISSEDSLVPKISRYDLVQGKRMLRRMTPKERSLTEESEDFLIDLHTNAGGNPHTESKDVSQYSLNQLDDCLTKSEVPLESQGNNQGVPSQSQKDNKPQEIESKLESLPRLEPGDKRIYKNPVIVTQRSDPGSEERTDRVFNFSRGRSLSPARPQTLDLSEDAPRSPQFPHWREMVRSPDKYKRRSNDSSLEDATPKSGDPETGETPDRDCFRGSGDAPSADKEVGNSDIPESSVMEQPSNGGSRNTQRQNSSVSTGSASLPSPTSPLAGSCRSWVSSRTSLSDMNMVDVATLVHNNVLPSVAIPLKEELNEQWEDWEKMYEEAVSAEHIRNFLTPSPSAESPESEVARRLCIIGDRVQEEYGDVIERAMEGVLSLPHDRLTYDIFITTLLHAQLISTPIRGWKQVALLVLFGQRLVLGLLSRGSRQVGRLVDFTVRAINDRAARFILDQGGWGNIPDFDLDLQGLSSHSSGLEVHLSRGTRGYTSDASPQTISTSVSENTITGDVSTLDGAVASTPAMPVATSSDNDTHSLGAASPSDENSNRTPAEEEKKAYPVPSPDSGCVTSSTPAVSGQLTPEEQKTIDDAVNSVRHEIQLIRQVSSDLKAEFDLSNNKKPRSPSWRQVAILTGALAAISVGVLVVIRRWNTR